MKTPCDGHQALTRRRLQKIISIMPAQPHCYAYLIQLSKPLGSERHQAMFYLGISHDWIDRFRQHCIGRGARMLAYTRGYRIGLQVV